MARSSGRNRLLPSVLAILSLLMASAAVWGGTAYAQEDTGNIAVFKTLVEDIGQQDTPQNRDTSLAGFTIDFEIFEGEGTEGELVETVTVTLGENEQGQGNVGAGSQGRSVSEDLPVGTFTVCEVEVAVGPDGEEVPLDAEPRPEAGEGGSTGGTNQEQLGENCIVVELTPGTAELQFLDERQDEQDDQQDDMTDDQQDEDMPEDMPETGAGGTSNSTSVPVAGLALFGAVLAAGALKVAHSRSI